MHLLDVEINLRFLQKKQVLPSSHSLKTFFGVSHWNLVLLIVFDLKSTDFPFKMS